MSLFSSLFDSQARVAAFPPHVASGKHGFTLDINMIFVAIIQAIREFFSFPAKIPCHQGKIREIFVDANKALIRDARCTTIIRSFGTGLSDDRLRREPGLRRYRWCSCIPDLPRRSGMTYDAVRLTRLIRCHPVDRWISRVTGG